MVKVGNPHEERARAIKAAKLVRVARRLLDEPDVTIDSIATADEQVRLRVAKVAGVNPPSEQTWAVMCALLEVEQDPEARPM